LGNIDPFIINTYTNSQRNRESLFRKLTRMRRLEFESL